MSKKWMCAIGAFWVCLSIAGCAGGTQSSLAETERGPYTDGTYTVRMPEYDQDGWQEYGTVKVADGFIAEVAYDALNENGGKKSQDPSYRDNMAVGNAVNGLPAAPIRSRRMRLCSQRFGLSNMIRKGLRRLRAQPSPHKILKGSWLL